MFSGGTRIASHKNTKALPTGGVCSFQRSLPRGEKKMSDQNKAQKRWSKAGRIPLKSEHGGSSTDALVGQDDEQKGFSFDPLREVREASRLLGGHWRIESSHKGEARMIRITD